MQTMPQRNRKQKVLIRTIAKGFKEVKREIDGCIETFVLLLLILTALLLVIIFRGK